MTTTRYGAHFVYCNPQRILINGVVEINALGKIAAIFSLNDCMHETANTIFYSGIIIPALLLPEDIPALENYSVFEVLNTRCEEKKIELQEGLSETIFVLQAIDLTNKRFSANTWLQEVSCFANT